MQATRNNFVNNAKKERKLGAMAEDQSTIEEAPKANDKSVKML
jgi:hypothetical protein